MTAAATFRPVTGWHARALLARVYGPTPPVQHLTPDAARRAGMVGIHRWRTAMAAEAAPTTPVQP